MDTNIEISLLDKYIDIFIEKYLLSITSAFSMIYGVDIDLQAQPLVISFDAYKLYLREELQIYLEKNPIKKNKYYYIVEYIYKKKVI